MAPLRRVRFGNHRDEHSPRSYRHNRSSTPRRWLVADVVNIWVQLPASFWQYANELARYGMLAIGWRTQHRTATVLVW